MIGSDVTIADIEDWQGKWSLYDTTSAFRTTSALDSTILHVKCVSRIKCICTVSNLLAPCQSMTRSRLRQYETYRRPNHGSSTSPTCQFDLVHINTAALENTFNSQISAKTRAENRDVLDGLCICIPHRLYPPIYGAEFDIADV